MINEQHMRTLAIPPSGAKDILTATSGTTATTCDTYDVQLQIASFGDEPFIVPALEVLARPLFNHSIEGMIGRDVLSKLVLTIDGPMQRISMQY